MGVGVCVRIADCEWSAFEVIQNQHVDQYVSTVSLFNAVPPKTPRQQAHGCCFYQTGETAVEMEDHRRGNEIGRTKKVRREPAALVYGSSTREHGVSG